MGRTETVAAKPDYEALIVGTGFGGMGAAIQLDRLGIRSFLMLDRADDLGGTWHVNSYPGLAVDIASVTYSYSFEPNPNWSRLYAPGAELKRYAEHVADKYNLRPQMRFNTIVEKAIYNEEDRCWTIYPKDQAPITAGILILATGFLSQPKQPDIPGIESFAGKIIHTADWDHDYDLNGRRAAVIGTGATAVQLLPEIAPKLEQLDVYQRTPIWVTPKLDGDIPPAIRRMFALLPLTQRSARLVSDSILETIMVTGVLYNKMLPFITRVMERVCKAHMRSQIKNPALRRKLTPQYSFGCKRPTFSNTYYPTFNRDNVELITEGIERIEPDGIVARDGHKRKIDTLVLATGFSLWEENFPAIKIIGRQGKDLGRWWRESRFQAYEGISMPGFPNLFNLPSPYAYSGLSFFTTIEAQMRHMARCLGEMQRKQARSFEVSQAANDAFLKDMKQRVGNSIFVNGNCAPANSYYFNQHGEATLLRPTSSITAMRQAGRFPLKDYQFV
ncbi:MAG TPA: NAD(P)/FAD-dependent oxidoreductase [Stenotrophobium sp.]|nr:NAD(P)/FAD-dependent oxidoreductase [Stenotrophobium sp.]